MANSKKVSIEPQPKKDMWSTNAYDRRPRERPKSVMNQAGRAAKDFGGPAGFNV